MSVFPDPDSTPSGASATPLFHNILQCKHASHAAYRTELLQVYFENWMATFDIGPKIDVQNDDASFFVLFREGKGAHKTLSNQGEKKKCHIFRR